MTALRIAIAQINAVVGDIAGNADKIIKAHAQASAEGAELVVAPELCLIGYPPEDLVLTPSFRAEATRVVHEIAAKTAKGAALIIGSVWEEAGKAYNAALLLDGGKLIHVQHKAALPNYGIFDEKRLFEAGGKPLITTCRGIKLGMLVCEDVWQSSLTAEIKTQGAELLIIINASPFEAGKLVRRKKVAAASGLPLVYVNLVGGQDDIIFDGGSFAMDAKGTVTAHLPEFVETVQLLSKNDYTPMSEPETLWSAMKMGLADYVRKNNFPGILLGLSGGVDSAVSAALAVDALGAGSVKGVLMSSPYTSRESVEDARESAKLLGIETIEIPISAGMNVFEEVLSPAFKASDWMENPSIGGNLQARLRGITLMALSNHYNHMVLSTCNKSEIAVGYSTLYGDSCGGYNVLKDLYKTQVYELANWRNKKGRVIPQRSITKAPTAELKPGQKDQDQLPPYDVLDKILHLHIEQRLSASEIIAKGFAKDVVEKVLHMVRISEYKRRQSAPGAKLSPMLFGKDRRFPLTNKAAS